MWLAVEQVRDQKQHTAVMRKRTNCVFDHVMFFNFPHLTREDVENSTVDISVFDADLITRDDLIGSFQLDLHTVYLRPHHEVRCCCWLTLCTARSPVQFPAEPCLSR